MGLVVDDQFKVQTVVEEVTRRLCVPAKYIQLPHSKHPKISECFVRYELRFCSVVLVLGSNALLQAACFWDIPLYLANELNHATVRKQFPEAGSIRKGIDRWTMSLGRNLTSMRKVDWSLLTQRAVEAQSTSYISLHQELLLQPEMTVNVYGTVRDGQALICSTDEGEIVRYPFPFHKVKLPSVSNSKKTVKLITDKEEDVPVSFENYNSYQHRQSIVSHYTPFELLCLQFGWTAGCKVDLRTMKKIGEEREPRVGHLFIVVEEGEPAELQFFYDELIVVRGSLQTMFQFIKERVLPSVEMLVGYDILGYRGITLRRSMAREYRKDLLESIALYDIRRECCPGGLLENLTGIVSVVLNEEQSTEVEFFRNACIDRDVVPIVLRTWKRMGIVSLSDLNDMSRPHMIECLLATNHRDVIIGRPAYEEREEYKGGTVKQPDRKVDTPSNQFDIVSCYPSIIAHARPGAIGKYLGSVCQTLLDERKQLKEENALIEQKAVKLLNNFTYGYLGCHFREEAALVTRLAREAIQEMIDCLSELKCDVLYADTDGVNSEFDPDNDTTDLCLLALNKRLAPRGLSVKLDQRFDRFVHIKGKAYIGLVDGCFVSSSLPDKKTSTPPFFRHHLRTMFELMLKGNKSQILEQLKEALTIHYKESSINDKRWFVCTMLRERVKKTKKLTQAEEAIQPLPGDAVAGERVHLLHTLLPGNRKVSLTLPVLDSRILAKKHYAEMYLMRPIKEVARKLGMDADTFQIFHDKIFRKHKWAEAPLPPAVSSLVKPLFCCVGCGLFEGSCVCRV